MTTPAVQAATEAVAEAWRNAGPVPSYHAAAQLKLLAEWPTLARAVVMLDVQLSEAARQESRK